MYHTTVLRNGHIIRWRLRDGSVNRFKVILSDVQWKYVLEQTNTNDYDDCDGEYFATIHRLIAGMPELT